MPYDIEFLTADEMKVAPYIDICPNGRVPTIFDPNTDITLWEVSRGRLIGRHQHG
jgi:glutathione S-transferase